MTNVRNINRATETTTISNEQRLLFNSVMRNLSPFGMIDGDVILASGSIPMELLYVDERYQGLREHRKLSNLKRNWDIRKLGPIEVVPHPEECRFAIVDGQGRFLVATEFGYESLYATVMMDAPSDPVERLKFEASYFIGQDTETEKVKPIEKHPARVIMGERSATELERILNQYSVTVTHQRGQRSGGYLGSYSEAYHIVDRYGSDCLEFIFTIINNAGWHEESNGYGTFVMRSLRMIYAEHERNRAEINEYLSRLLRTIDPELFSAGAKTAYPKRDFRMACALWLEDKICAELHLERRIFNVA